MNTNQIQTRTPTTDADRRNAKPWTVDEVNALLELPFNDLMFRAQQIHREHFDPNAIQLSTLLSIKTGGCEEDCKYCPQSAHFDTGLKAEKLLPLEEVLEAARASNISASGELGLYAMALAALRSSHAYAPAVLAMGSASA